MKIKNLVLIGLLFAALLCSAVSFAAETAEARFASVAYANGVVSFSAVEETYVYAVSVVLDDGRELAAKNIANSSGDMFFGNGAIMRPGSSMLLPKAIGLRADTSVKCEVAGVGGETVAQVVIALSDDGKEKAVFDFQSEEAVADAPFGEVGFSGGAIAFTANEDILIYGVTVKTADGREYVASAIANTVGNLYTSGGSSFWAGSSLKLPREIGLRAGTSVQCKVSGVSESNIAKVVIALNERGTQAAVYDYQAGKWE